MSSQPASVIPAAVVLCFFPAVAATSTNYALLDKSRIHYFSAGEGDRALVLIHGWACDASFWRLQITGLAKQWRVLAVDLLGHGKSDKPRVEYTPELHARAVQAVVQAAGVRDVVLVGHSMGAAVARQFILDRPTGVLGIVIVDGAVWRTPPGGVQEKKSRVAPFVRSLRSSQHRKVASDFIDSMFVPQTPRSLRSMIRSKMLATPAHVAASEMEGLSGGTMWNTGPSDVPALAVYAKTGSGAQNRSLIEEFFPNLVYEEWDGVGHFLMLERPDQFNRLLLSFAERLKSTLEGQ